MDLNKIWKYPILLVIFLFNPALAVTENNDLKCDFSRKNNNICQIIKRIIFSMVKAKSGECL
jgi:hypothetical protein